LNVVLPFCFLLSSWVTQCNYTMPLYCLHAHVLLNGQLNGKHSPLVHSSLFWHWAISKQWSSSFATSGDQSHPRRSKI